MSIDSLNLEDDFSDDLFAFANNLFILWKGRQITLDDALAMKEEVQERILSWLFSSDPASRDFDERAAHLAWIGATPHGRPLLQREIAQLFATQDGVVIQAGFSKTVSKFWKKHKTEIIVGTIIVAVIVTVAVVAVYSCGTAAEATAAAGGAIIEGAAQALDDEENKTYRKARSSERASSSQPPQETAPAETQDTPPPQEASTVETSTPDAIADPQPSPFDTAPALPHEGGPLFVENGIYCDGEYRSYFEVLQRAPLESLFSPMQSSEPLLHIETAPKEDPPSSQCVPAIPLDLRYSWTQGALVEMGYNMMEDRSDLRPVEIEASRPFTTGGMETQTTLITGINGMNATPLSATSNADYLKELSGGQNIHWAYNASHGPAIDVLEVVSLNLQGISPNTSDLLIQEWIAFDTANKGNPDAKLLHVCHSQGAIHTKNALLQTDPEIRRRVIVVAIAPATVVPKEICYDSFNYASKRDPIPSGELLRAGFLDTIESSMEWDSDFEQAHRYEDLLQLHKDQLILLDPHPDATGIDHDFQSPTFQERIMKHMEDYNEKNGLYTSKDTSVESK